MNVCCAAVIGCVLVIVNASPASEYGRCSPNGWRTRMLANIGKPENGYALRRWSRVGMKPVSTSSTTKMAMKRRGPRGGRHPTSVGGTGRLTNRASRRSQSKDRGERSQADSQIDDSPRRDFATNAQPARRAMTAAREAIVNSARVRDEVQDRGGGYADVSEEPVDDRRAIEAREVYFREVVRSLSRRPRQREVRALACLTPRATHHATASCTRRSDHDTRV